MLYRGPTLASAAPRSNWNCLARTVSGIWRVKRPHIGAMVVGGWTSRTWPRTRYEMSSVKELNMAIKLVSHASAVLSVIACISLISDAGSAELPLPWQHKDIGTVTVAGSASAADGVITLKGTL